MFEQRAGEARRAARTHPVRVGLRPQHVPARPVPVALRVPREEARQAELQVLCEAAALLLGGPHLVRGTVYFLSIAVVV